MNEKEQEYDVVIDVLNKHIKVLSDMDRGGHLGIMTQLRLEQIGQMTKAIRIWKMNEEEGWRQCAKGQRTTQFCGLLEEAVRAEREACAKIAETAIYRHDIADAIRKRKEESEC